MRLHRFYVPQPLGEEVVIDDVQLVSQLRNVFRYREGDLVILFNGSGEDITYSISTIAKSSCVLRYTRNNPSFIPSFSSILFLSIIKKDNFELVVQKATELGITTIVPIITEHSQKLQLPLERLKKIAIEAAEQCGRGDIPEIAAPKKLEETVDFFKDTQTFLFDMDGATIPQAPRNGTISLFIGPEGGWGEKDYVFFKQMGIPPYKLHNTVLRAETAAIAACAILLA